ncbi:MAG: hypothetical protein JWN99_2095 [Ilumatobacteraceae bacterium]|nr:hypothetical protein [Ilumatobacteraceae bacterium]
MHDGQWDNGWGTGSGLWMAIMMIALLAATAWVIVSLVRHANITPPAQHQVSGPPPSSRPGPQDILDERLARGEIEPEEYSKRLAVLRDSHQQ